MKSNTTQSLVLAVSFTLIGLGLATLLTPEGNAEDSPAASSPLSKSERVERLQKALKHARFRIGLLEEQLNDLVGETQTANISSATNFGVAPLDPDQELLAQVAGVSSQSLTDAARLEELQALIEKAKRGEIELSEEELKARVSEIRGQFTAAIESEDGDSAIKAMKALSELDERAYPELMSLWAKMRENGWLGLNGGQRRLWFNADVFHWALKNDQLAGLDEKQSLAFKVEALRYLPWYETDPSKQADTYKGILESLEAPGAEMSKDDRRRLRRGWRRNGDLYRGVVSRLAGVNSPEATEMLMNLADNNNLPVDVRAQAYRGLGRHSGPEANRLIESGMNSQNRAIRNAATIAQVRRQPPASGMLVTQVNRKGLGGRTGLAVGTVITKYNGQRIRNQHDLQRAMRRSRGKSVQIEYNTNGVITQSTVKGGKNLGIGGERVRR